MLTNILAIVRFILEATGFLFLSLLTFESVRLHYMVWKYHRKERK